MNGAPVRTMEAFRSLFGKIEVGDTVTIEVSQRTGPFRTTVVVPVLQLPTVHVEDVPGATERQRAIRDAWLAGAPTTR